MFDGYVLAKQKQLPKWLVPVFAAALLLHVFALSGAVVHGYWAIEKLPLPKGGIELAIAPPPPPPPPAKKGNPANKPKVDKKVVKNVPKETTQPVKLDKPPEEVASIESDSIGNPEGTDDGADWSDCTGPTCDENSPLKDLPPPAPKKPPPPPQIVPQQVLQQQLVSGEKMIRPDDTTKTQIMRDGKSQVIGAFKICISPGGSVTAVEMIKSTGYGAYDGRLKGTMRTWKFNPFMVNGKAVAICSAYTFIYKQTN